MAVSWPFLLQRPFGREGRQQFVQQYRIRGGFDVAQSRIFISFVRMVGFTGMGNGDDWFAANAADAESSNKGSWVSRG